MRTHAGVPRRPVASYRQATSIPRTSCSFANESARCGKPHRRCMRPSAPWMKNARKSSADIRSIRRQISRQCCGGWSRTHISQCKRQPPDRNAARPRRRSQSATASPSCAERGRARRGSAGLSQSNEKRKAMIDHIYLPVSDLQRSSAVYKKVLGPLGIDMPYEVGQPPIRGFAINNIPGFWLKNGEVAKDLYVAFTAKSADAVRASYKAGLDAGATSHKAPSLRPEWRADYFAANIGDPDGYNIEIAYKR